MLIRAYAMPLHMRHITLLMMLRYDAAGDDITLLLLYDARYVMRC